MVSDFSFGREPLVLVYFGLFLKFWSNLWLLVLYNFDGAKFDSAVHTPKLLIFSSSKQIKTKSSLELSSTLPTTMYNICRNLMSHFNVICYVTINITYWTLQWMKPQKCTSHRCHELQHFVWEKPYFLVCYQITICLRLTFLSRRATVLDSWGRWKERYTKESSYSLYGF
jgi:hypothetical protein